MRLPVQTLRAGGRSDGFALALALVLTAALAAGTLALLQSARMSGRRAAEAAARDRLRAAAAEGVRAALRRLADDDDLRVDHTNETWAVPGGWVDPSGIAVNFRSTDAQAAFNLNNLAVPTDTAPRRPAEDILADLFAEWGDPLAADHAGALRDWVDADGEGRWETPLYRERKPPYACPDLPLTGWEEWLSSVAGFSREWLARPWGDRRFEPPARPLRSVLAILPGPARHPVPVNVNTASPEVLLAIAGGDQAGWVRALLSLREAEPLRSLEPLAVLADPVRFDRMRAYLDVKSLYFTVEAEARLDNRSARVTALVRRDADGRVTPLRWWE